MHMKAMKTGIKGRWQRRRKRLTRRQRLTIIGALATAAGAGISAGDPAPVLEFVGWLLSLLGKLGLSAG